MSANTKLSVSVVIPAYNAEQSIRQTIDSVLRQTHQPDEIIVVDDGSTDRTAEIAKTYQQVTYIYQTNAGVSAACNTGIENARYHWIAFIDSDDVWLPQKLELQMSLLQRNPDLKWVLCNYYINDCPRNRKFINFKPQTAEQLMGDNSWIDFFDGVVAGLGWVRCCMVAERKVLEEAGLFRPGYSAAEDLDLCIRIALMHARAGFVVQPQAEYTFAREGSISSQSFPDRVKARCRNLESLLELSEKYGKRAEVERVARKLLVDWIRPLLENKDEGQLLIRDMLNRFGDLLPMNYKIELRLKTSFPCAGRLIFKLYFKLKRILGGFGER
jgi:glycosyltransferase involved in cell wall biosynthesis